MATNNRVTATSDELDIITRIRGEVKGQREHTGLNLFLVWGYPTLFCFLVEFAALMLWNKNWTEWFWVFIPLVGAPLMNYFVRKDYDRTGRRTHEESIALHLWVMIGIASALAGLTMGLTNIYPIAYCTLQSLIIALGCFLTGVISRFRPMTVGGIVGTLLAFVCPFLQGNLQPWQLLVTALIAVITLIIPGHLMRHYVANVKSE